MTGIIFIFLIGILCRENAVIFFLCRNEDIDTLEDILENFEDIFNRRFQYPYLFANNKPFTAEFIRRVKDNITSEAEFIQLEPEEWEIPPWIDRIRMNAASSEMARKGVIHGESPAYRQMCRFFSGFFYRNKHMLKYDWYWRVEPQHIKFHCKLHYDPFTYMKRNNLQYGFNMNVYEFMETIPSLWNTTLDYVQKNKHLIQNQKTLEEIVDANGNYTGCHFWTNFEIADLNFFRSPIYQNYFDHLDRSGGFFYERWGDAPIHSLAAGFFLGKSKIHYFDDIGYEHTGMMHCPSNGALLVNCNCQPTGNEPQWSCIRRFIKEDL